MTKSNCRRITVHGVFCVLAALGGQTLKAATIYVGTCGTPNQPTIQNAVNASAAGGTVKICPGTYPEQVIITQNLNLIGVTNGTADAVVITPPTGGVQVNTSDLYQPPSQSVAAQVLVQNAKIVNISNITVDGSGNSIGGCAPDLRGIYYQNASGSINGVVTRNQALSASLIGCQSGQGIFVQSSYPGAPGYAGAAAGVTIQNSSVHTFQKNGITIDGPKAASIIALNQIAGQGPTTGAAENGVQISDGAAASITNNVIVDSIWQPDTFSQPYNAASGILIYASQYVLIENNSVGTTQFGIATVSDATYGTPGNPQGLADHTIIAFNQVLNTQIFDAIDVCSNGNTIAGNAVFNAAESGIHLDSTCGSTGLGNIVQSNTVNEACAGILLGTAGASSLAARNSLFNVVNTTVPGDTCSPAGNAAIAGVVPLVSAASGRAGRPTPVR